jgi:flagellar biogenesis protein FliO
VNGAFLALRVAASLGAVLGLLLFIGRGRTGRLLRGRRTAAPLEILARQGLARSAAVVVVRAGDRGLVLGVTDTHVSMLAEVDPDTMDIDLRAAGTPPDQGPSPRPAWRDALDSMRDRTVRRS